MDKKEQLVDLLVDTLRIAITELKDQLSNNNLSSRQKGIAAKTLTSLVNKFNLQAPTSAFEQISITIKEE